MPRRCVLVSIAIQIDLLCSGSYPLVVYSSGSTTLISRTWSNEMPSRWNSPSQLVMQAVPVEKRHVGVALSCHDPVADLEVGPVVRQAGGREGNPVVDAAVALSGFLIRVHKGDRTRYLLERVVFRCRQRRRLRDRRVRPARALVRRLPAMRGGHLRHRPLRSRRQRCRR